MKPYEQTKPLPFEIHFFDPESNDGFHICRQGKPYKFSIYVIQKAPPSNDRLRWKDTLISMIRMEAGRVSIVRYLRLLYPVEEYPNMKVRVLSRANHPITKKALGARMGKGQGDIQSMARLIDRKQELFVAPLYEIVAPPHSRYEDIRKVCTIRRGRKVGHPTRYQIHYR